MSCVTRVPGRACSVLASGGRDRSIFLDDVRVRGGAGTTRLEAHRQEVCGLRWSFDGRRLASGGNDNRLFVWEVCARVRGAGRRRRGVAVATPAR
jgi:WD40 repeat protein